MMPVVSRSATNNRHSLDLGLLPPIPVQHSRLVGDELDVAMRRFPLFDLSYESTFHKKAGPEYTVGLIIPRARKYFVWFSFYRDSPVCYLLQTTKKSIYRINVAFHPNLATGTILYGSVPSLGTAEDDRISPTDNLFFIAEDIAYYQGIPLRKLNFGAKLGFIHALLSKYIYPITTSEASPYAVIALPVMFAILGENAEAVAREAAGYPIHCVQYRSLTEDAPYMNLPVARICAATVPRTEDGGAIATPEIRKMSGTIDIRMPQYKLPTVFMVFAKMQYDIYSLCAIGAARAMVEVDIAYIPNCRTSSMMNGLFRRITENADIDCAEESDDEAEFQDVRVDKYVDLKKSVAMECEFHPKFRKWVPIKPVNDAPIVAATRLCR